MEPGVSGMVVNLDKLEIKLNKMVSDETIQKGLNEACGIVAAAATVNAPDGGTGNLQRSIKWRVEGDTGEVYSDAPYAVYVHQGTGKYAVNGNGRPGWWVFVKGDSADPSKSSTSRKIYTAEQAFWIKERLIEKGIPEGDI